MKKWITVLCLVLCLALPMAAGAERVQPEHTASLTLQLTEAGKGLPGATFTVYRVAEMDSDARFALLPGYAAPGVDINEVKGAAAWSALAETFLKQAGTPTAAAVTNGQGKALFSRVNTGLYLVVGQPVEIGHWVYRYAPFMVSVPGKDADGWQYDVLAEVKHEKEAVTCELTIIKFWQDSGYTSQRPGGITVGLYCDGVLAQNLVLNAANNWRCKVEGLETIHKWTVQEMSVPAGYTVAYGQQDGALTITNTYKAPPSSGSTIPQTGLLWWPVPVLAVLGLTLMIIGLAMRRKWRIDHDER